MGWLVVPLFPPTTSTLPLSCVLVVEMSVAEWALRGPGMGLVVASQVPAPELGSYVAAVASKVVPLMPPVTSTFPLGSKVAVCCSRGMFEFKLVAAIQVPALGE